MSRSRILNIIYTGNPAGAIAANKAVAGSTAATMGVLAKGGVALAGFAVGGVTALAAIGNSFDKAYDKIRINTGATGDRLEGLKNDFKGVASNSGASFDKISSVLSDLNRRLGLTGKPLQTLTRQFLFLDAKGLGALETTVPAITRLFGDWGVAVKDQSATLDMMFRASQATGIGVDRLGELMVQFGSPLRQLGLSFDFTTAMFSRFEKEGVNISTALPGLRQALKNFAKEGKEPAPALMETMRAIRDTSSVAKANTLAFDIFGARAGPDLAAAIREGRFDLDELMATISGGKETILGAAKDTSSLSQKLALLKNKVLVALEPLAIKVFDALSEGAAMVVRGWDTIKPSVDRVMGAIKGWIADVTPAIRSWVEDNLANLAKWWEDHGPTIISVAQKIGRALLRAGEMVKNAAQTIVRNWEDIRGPLSVVARVVGAVLIPVLIRLGVTAAVSAAKQAAAWAVTSTAATRAKISYVKSTVMMVAKWAWMGVQALAHAAKIAAAWLISLGPVGLIIAAVTAVAALVVVHFDTIKKAIAAVWNWVKDNWKTILVVLTGPIGVAVLLIIKHWETIKNAVMAAVRFVWNVVRSGFNLVRAAVDLAWTVIVGIIRVAWTVIKTLVETQIRSVLFIVRTVFNAVRAVVTTVWNAIRTAISVVWNAIKTTVGGAVQWVWQRVQLGFTTAKNIALSIFRTVRDTLAGIWESIKTKVRDSATWVKDKVKSAFTAAKDAILRAFRGVRDALSGIWSTILSKVRGPINAIIGFINTLLGGIDKVLEILPGNLSLNFRIPLLGGSGGGSGSRRPQGGGGATPMLARGGVPPFVTDGIRAIVGEGNRRYPEYVIPTDPRYRGRASALLTQAAARITGAPMYGIGGVIGDIGGAISDAVGGAVGTFRRGAATAIFGPVKQVYDRAISGLPWKFLRQVGKAFGDWIYDFVKGVDARGMEAGAGGAGGSATGLAANVAAYMAFWKKRFPWMTIGGWRARGSVPGSDHPKGKALDLMTTSGQVAADIIATFVKQVGAKYWIWNRQIAQATGGWRARSYGGPSPHTDHVHLSYYKRGAWQLLRDQMAMLHKDEMVVPAGPANGLRDVLARPPASGPAGAPPIVQHFHGITDPRKMATEMSNEVAWQWRTAG